MSHSLDVAGISVLTMWLLSAVALLLPSFTCLGGPKPLALTSVMGTEAVCSTEDSLHRMGLTVLALLPVPHQTCYARLQKEGRTKLREQSS